MNPATDMVVYVIPASGSEWSDWIGVIAAIAAALSAIAALFALRFNAKQIELHEHHNQRMVTPYLTAHTSTREMDKAYRLAIANHGIGPAVVTDIQLYADGQLVPGNGTNQMEHAIQLLWGALTMKMHYGIFSVGDFIPAGHNVQLIFLENLPIHPKSIANDVVTRLRLVIQYECVLGLKYTYDSALDLNPK